MSKNPTYVVHDDLTGEIYPADGNAEVEDAVLFIVGDFLTDYEESEMVNLIDALAFDEVWNQVYPVLGVTVVRKS